MKVIKENNILRKYVDETVHKFINQDEFEKSLILSDRVEATVVFINICQFTVITENEKPDYVVKLLNRYFEVMVKEVLTHDGFVNKFIGDTIMAVFQGDFHLDRAMDVCLAVRKQAK